MIHVVSAYHFTVYLRPQLLLSNHKRAAERSCQLLQKVTEGLGAANWGRQLDRKAGPLAGSANCSVKRVNSALLHIHLL